MPAPVPDAAPTAAAGITGIGVGIASIGIGGIGIADVHVPDLGIADADPLMLAARWHAEGETVAIATVVRTWGSSPRPAGSRMALTRSGRMAGSVSGGCIEGEVALRADAVMADGKPALLHFAVSSERAWSVGLACGGEVDIFVEALAGDEAG